MKSVAVMVLALFAISGFAANSNLCVMDVHPIINNDTPETTEDKSDDIIIPITPDGEAVPLPIEEHRDQVNSPADDLIVPDELDNDADNDAIDDELEEETAEGIPNNSDTPTIENDNSLQF
jgi:hypothetical protein